MTKYLSRNHFISFQNEGSQHFLDQKRLIIITTRRHLLEGRGIGVFCFKGHCEDGNCVMASSHHNDC